MIQQDTYAATLAARTFRALMAISAAFDLDIYQYDAVSAFINSPIDDEIFCECPEGFDKPGYCWKLRKALYGLKQAPILWYKLLTMALEELGLAPVPGFNFYLPMSGLSYSSMSITLWSYAGSIIRTNYENLRKLS